MKNKIPKELQKKFIEFNGVNFAVFPVGMTEFANFIVKKIGVSNYIFSIEDILLLNKVSIYWNKIENKEDCIKAIDDFLKNNKNIDFIDPYELVIDAFN